MASNCPGSADFSLYLGDTTPISWQFLNADSSLFDITGYNFTLLIVYPTGQQSYTTPASAELTIDVPSSTLTWTPTTQESAALPLGPSSQYQLAALIDATVSTWVAGIITGLGIG